VSKINTTIKTTSVCDGDGRGWLAGVTDGLAGWPATGDGGRGQPARSRRWAVQVRVFALHTTAGWAWWPVSVGRRLGAF